MNIVVIVSDTLRRDHLPFYGNNEIIAPHLDAFSRESLIFDQARPASFPTVPTRADIMTGRYNFVNLPWGPLPQTTPTLAEQLSRAGYMTAAVGDTPFLARKGYGYDRGFNEFIYVRGQLDGTERDYRRLQRPFSEEEGYCAPKTFKEAADWLYRHHEKDFFLYVDTWDPHEPWDPPSPYVEPYLPGYDGEVIEPSYWNYREDGYSERDIEVAHACYCGEITMVDRWFGFFMERLRTLNLLEDTIIVFFSDHGFYFGEHGLFGKRRFRWPDGSNFEEGFAKGMTVEDRLVYRSPLHNEITRVPLLISMPGQEPGRVTGLVSLPDLMPTLIELAGAKMPESVQAPSLLPLIQGKSDAVHEFTVTSAPFEEKGDRTKTVDDHARKVAEISPSTITDGKWDLLYAVHGQPVELYDNEKDPDHEHNLIEEHTDIAQRLHAQFASWLEEIDTPEHYLAPRREL
jgi:arylsulfatase A-like enzyme